MATKKKKAPAAKKATAGAPKSEAVSTPTNTLYGVEVLGNVKKGGNARHPVSAQLTLAQIKVQKNFNPRSSIGDIESLSKSIKAEGLLSALVVRPSSKDGTFELIAGERRYRALESLDWKEPIPVLIRTDLKDDDDRALAVAVAENSEDGRSNLNPVELGRVCEKFAEKDWSVARIATECGMHPQKVRRVLELVKQPAAVRKKLESGELTMNAGLELAKLDESVRNDVIKAMEDGGASSAADIRRIRKEVQTEKNLEEAAKSGPKKTKRGTAPKRVATAWRGSREKQAMLQELCGKLLGSERDEGDADFIETRAMVCALLWDRGDLTALAVPHEDAKDSATKKALTVFWSIVGAEAAKNATDGGEEAEGEEAESDETDGGDAAEDETTKKPKKAKAGKPKKKPKKAKAAKKVEETEETEEDAEEPEGDEDGPPDADGDE